MHDRRAGCTGHLLGGAGGAAALQHRLSRSRWLPAEERSTDAYSAMPLRPMVPQSGRQASHPVTMAAQGRQEGRVAPRRPQLAMALGGLGALAARLQAVRHPVLAANHEGRILLTLACSAWVVGSSSRGQHAVNVGGSGSSCRPALPDAPSAKPLRAALGGGCAVQRRSSPSAAHLGQEASRSLQSGESALPTGAGGGASTTC